MKHLVALLCMSIAFTVSAAPQTDPMNPAEARAAVGPSLKAMGDAANAHDVDRHVGFYAHDAAVTLIANGEEIVGWDAIHDKQREWWKDGKTDVVYTMIGRPEYMVPGPGLVMTTLLVNAKRTLPGGEIKEGRLAVSALWQQRPEGWRVIYSHESTGG